MAPNDSVERFESLGVDVFRGEGSFVSPKVLVVEGQELRAKCFVIATGTRAAVPPIQGLGNINYFTNETIFDDLTEKPDAMLILGGGPIGCEMAQAFARLGVKVALLQHGRRLLEKEDHAVSDFVLQRLEAEGVKVLTEVSLESVAKDSGRIVARYSDSEKVTHQLTADAVLIAAGRLPNVENLNLSKAGVEFGKTGVKVNAYLQTTQPHIYAAGDVTGAYLFTHMADYQAATVIRNTLVPLQLLRQRVDYSAVPWCTFLDPEIATIGLTEIAAKKKGVAYDLIEKKAAAVDRAMIERSTDGFIRVLVARGTDKILGATIVAEHAGELVHEIAVAMKCGAGLKKIASTIHVYPTFSSLVEKAGDKMVKRGLTPRARKITGWLYARSRA